MQIPFVDLAAQHRALEKEILAAIRDSLARCDFILGSAVEEFERAFAAFVETGHAVGVSSGLDALRLALMALDVGPGDEVVLPANTYIATAFAVTSVGARPVLCDCRADTYGIDTRKIEAVLTARTKAILPVHLTGQAADMDEVLDIARRHKLHVVEDAAQAHGTKHRGKPCGSIGIIGCFSFYPGKNLGACGDAGMTTTNDERLAEVMREIRNNGQREKYHHVRQGLNARLDTMQAAILSIKLMHLPDWNAARNRAAAAYRQRLQGVGDLAFQQIAPRSTHVQHLFVVETARRDGLLQHLKSRGVATGVHYPVPVHLQPCYASLGYHLGDFPVAEHLARRMLSLPMFPELDERQIDYIETHVREFYAA